MSNQTNPGKHLSSGRRSRVLTPAMVRQAATIEGRHCDGSGVGNREQSKEIGGGSEGLASPECHRVSRGRDHQK
jgi:hypothetical protein